MHGLRVAYARKENTSKWQKVKDQFDEAREFLVSPWEAPTEWEGIQSLRIELDLDKDDMQAPTEDERHSFLRSWMLKVSSSSPQIFQN
jgi:hypothetical protein